MAQGGIGEILVSGHAAHHSGPRGRIHVQHAGERGRVQPGRGGWSLGSAAAPGTGRRFAEAEQVRGALGQPDRRPGGQGSVGLADSGDGGPVLRGHHGGQLHMRRRRAGRRRLRMAAIHCGVRH